MAGRTPKRNEVVKYTPSYTNKTINDIETEARKLGLDGSTYIAYRDAGMLDDYVRRKFHDDCARNATPTIIEKSWIGNMHGNAAGGVKIK